MPDWSYHPLFRPLLFRLPAERARDWTLGAMGSLAALPWGRRVIATMGHMAPPAALQKTLWGVTFQSPVALGAGIDVRGRALKALAEFGFGFLELGPVTEHRVTGRRSVERRISQEAILYPEVAESQGVDQVTERLKRLGKLKVPLAVRLGHRPDAEAAEAAAERGRLIERLSGEAAFFTLDFTEGIGEGGWSEPEWERHVAAVVKAADEHAPGKAVVLCLPPDLAAERVERLLAPALRHGVKGVLVTGGVVVASDGGRLVGLPAKSPALEMVRFIRGKWGRELPVLASGGVHEPQDALDFLEAGADVVMVDSGLVYSGPGLAKRINEAVEWWAFQIQREGGTGQVEAVEPSTCGHFNHPEQTFLSTQPPAPDPLFTLFRPGWPWIACLGLSLLFGGMLAWWIAATVVVLPYDLAFLGLTREEVDAVNDNLLYFMSHDRISLAGVMMSIGVNYYYLARYPFRRGEHWAQMAVMVSAVTGFASFFLYLGYGYFDPLHALVAVLLLPMFLLGIFRRGPRSPRRVNLRNTRAWKRHLAGQLLFVCFGAGLLLAGLAISYVGITDVFVPEDLAYLGTAREALAAVNPNLIPLIAHDRAGFGGALVADGLLYLLVGLWSFRQGEKWLWRMLLFGGFPGFFAAFSTHGYVGYVDHWHLAPAYLALLMYAAGLYLTYPYLFDRPASKK